MRLKRTPPLSVAWTIKTPSVASEARFVPSLAASIRLPDGALRSSGRFVAFTLKSLRWRDTIGNLASSFQETLLGVLGFPERLGALAPSLFPFRCNGEFKIHASGDTPCRYDTPQFPLFIIGSRAYNDGRRVAYA